jgi:hypothetical protein
MNIMQQDAIPFGTQLSGTVDTKAENGVWIIFNLLGDKRRGFAPFDNFKEQGLTQDGGLEGVTVSFVLESAGIVPRLKDVNSGPTRIIC